MATELELIRKVGEVEMKGKELIDWIQKNRAEEADFVVQYRDGGGDYNGTEEPYLIFEKHGLRYERDGEFVADTRTVLL